MIHKCKQHGDSHGMDFCPYCPPRLARPKSSTTVSLTRRELDLLLQYWDGDVVAMGDADAEDPSNPVQPIGKRIRDKLCAARARIG